MGLTPNLPPGTVPSVPNGTVNLPAVTAEDLKDPNLNRLNRLIKLIASIFTDVTGGNGPYTFKSNMSAPAFFSSAADPSQIPSSGGLLTIDAAKKLFATGSHSSSSSGSGSGFLYGTHANRLIRFPAKNQMDGAFYYETDRFVLYQNQVVNGVPSWVFNQGNMHKPFTNRPTDLGLNDVSFVFIASDWNAATWIWSGTVWLYRTGNGYQRTQSQLAALAGTLTLNDVHLLVEVTDYFHFLVWNGTGFAFNSGDQSDYIVDALAAPQGGLWQACDGTTVNVLNGDGTLLSRITPNWNGQDAFGISTGTHAAGSSTAASVGVTPTTTESAQHTHSVTVTGNTSTESSTHTHTFSGSGSVGTTTVNAGAGSPVTVGAGGTVAISGTTGTESATHTHPVSITVTTGNELATHTHLVPAPTEAAGGLPKRVAFLKYLRR